MSAFPLGVRDEAEGGDHDGRRCLRDRIDGSCALDDEDHGEPGVGGAPVITSEKKNPPLFRRAPNFVP